jgi:hypothetical protein
VDVLVVVGPVVTVEYVNSSDNEKLSYMMFHMHHP